MAAKSASRHPQRKSSQVDEKAAFLNVPYDRKYEPLFLAFIAGLCGFGLTPRATAEVTTSNRRLEKIIGLITECRYSFHDLSRVELDHVSPRTPRFNMPFELGLVVSHGEHVNRRHEWFVFESKPHRLKKSLSDLDGTDPYLHDGKARGVLRALSSAMFRKKKAPTLAELEQIYRDLRKAARAIREQMEGGSLFDAKPFGDLVSTATELAKERIAAFEAR